ncbi:27S pre-rRNA (guanosine2922-2'-O)-methyltransferase [Saccharomycopsis crataegensis]|uniref:27S pre-rRNA (Guanosine2922-2'-O)-methyltransferase n=1 Tax=Saccharomycopsis crataegensis TaxID=43959 RepID=A0AAV5QV00_9ASCO|nr:27S pre-rRNA (guanosine2922-2'-O)-methyltransferase [Saccharomycopsis crataegensis]
MAKSTQKKNAKGRLDRYYFLAKEKGYRARSAFKILQINSKYNNFLSRSKVVIDLCAAPGSWCQVASQVCPPSSLIVGVDIVQIKPLKNVTFFRSDITSQDCKSQLAGFLKTVKADVVLHDGAPNVGLNWYQDAYYQSILTLSALKLATEHLAPGGIFITKIFRSRDYNKLMWIFNQLFEKVEATKPPSSRDVSAEIFVFCKGYKAPKRIDPKFLDAKEVFQELPDGKQNMEAKVFNPDKKVRKRDGYEEGDYLLFHATSIMDLVKTDTPIDMLGSMSQFTYDKEDPEWKILKKMKETNTEFFECIKDLKVLGRKEFKAILRWRRKARDLLGIEDESKKDEDQVEVAPLTEEEKIDKELDQMAQRQKQKQKREKKKSNEVKQKEIYRMQMDMITDKEIGIEAAQNGSEALFNLESVKKAGILDDIRKGKKRMVFNNQDTFKDTEIFTGEDEIDAKNEDSDMDYLDDLEGQLNSMHQTHKERLIERNASAKAKFARGGDDEEWAGIEDKADDDKESDADEKDYESDDTDGELSDSDEDEQIMEMIRKRDSKKPGLSERAKLLFDDSIFKETEDVAPVAKNQKQKIVEQPANKEEDSDVEMADSSDEDSSGDENNGKIQLVRGEKEFSREQDSDFDSEEEEETNGNYQSRVDIATVEAMTLAHQLALGHKSRHDVVDEGFHKYSFRDQDDLPEWFMDDEKQHSKIAKPMTKEAAYAIKEKMKQLNARPIKKVLEAQGRKKLRALRRIEKLKKKSELIYGNEALSEKDKADEITKLQQRMSTIKGGKRSKPKVTVVVARGGNKGLSGRPKGVRGKYKMVDGVMKNEMRALKRIAKKNKKNGKK